MPKTKISEFSATPGNNTDIDGINIAEGCAPSGINDAIRELMAQLKDFQAGTAGDSFNGPIGSTTPAAGTFTNLSASGTFALTGDQVQISEGGTGQTTANAAFNALAPSQSTHAGKYLKTDGTNTSWDALDISTADITGTLPVANGGTGVTSSTGTGSVVLSASPTFTGTVNGAALTLSSSLTLSGGTANGVAYLNGSKVLTTGSALNYDGTNLTVSNAGAQGFEVRPNSGDYSGGINLFSYNRSTSAWAPMGSFASYFAWQVNASEQARLTSTGLGIGTSSPAQKLDVRGGSIVVDTAAAGLNPTVFFDHDNFASGTRNYIQMNRVTEAMLFGVANADRMTIDSSGNLGLGVTPSAWSTGKALELGFLGNALWGNAADEVIVSQNAYFNSGWKYATSRKATHYSQYDAQHRWFTAPSGTAGNAISWTQAMTLDASANLSVGFTSASYQGKIGAQGIGTSNAIFTSNTTASSGTRYHMAFYENGVERGSITSNGSTTAYNTSSDYRLKNITGAVTNSGAYIDSLKPVEGTWKSDGSAFVGLIAHEAQEVSRTTVATGTKDGEEMQGMDYSNSEFIANIIAELQSLRARVAQLEAN